MLFSLLSILVQIAQIVLGKFIQSISNIYVTIV